MSEWFKILVSTVVGFSTAIVLEPLKYQVSRYFAAKRTKANIYEELGNLYSVFCLDAGRDDELFCTHAFNLGLADAFDYYYGTQRENFYAIKQNVAIRGFYEVLRVIRNAVHEKSFSGVTGAIRVGDEFRYRFDNNFLDKARVTSHALKLHEVAQHAINTPLTPLEHR